MKVTMKQVQCFNRHSIPEEGKTIDDDLNIEDVIKNSKFMDYYFRKPKDCPFGRGNWILDLTLKDGTIISYKYPKEMTEERFLEFLKPLMDRAKQVMKEKMNWYE